MMCEGWTGRDYNSALATYYVSDLLKTADVTSAGLEILLWKCKMKMMIHFL